MTAEYIAKQLIGRRVGAGWVARCPAHDDKNPSLSLRDVDGKLLVYCHAGCSQRNVIEALKARGLWSEAERVQTSTIIKTYAYTDAAGRLLYEVVRCEPKDFKFRYPDGAGGWTWKKHPDQVLYHLPEVLENPIVFLCEGEKDAYKLREHDFVATTNAGGANAPWLDSYTEVLREHEVILIPDNDRPGRQRVLRIGRALQGNVCKANCSYSRRRRHQRRDGLVQCRPQRG